MDLTNLVKNPLQQRRLYSLEKADRFIEDRGGRGLTPRELHAVSRKALAGWSLTFKGEDLLITADKNFPFSPPEIFIGKAHRRRLGAHVEGSGKLCLAPPHATYSQGEIELLLETLLEDAVSLLLAEEPDEVFIEEFYNYWLRDMAPSESCLSLLSLEGPSRKVFGWHGKLYSVFAETEAELRDWLGKKHCGGAKKNLQSEPFLWLKGGLTPKEFPKCQRDVLLLAHQKAEESVPLLIEAVSIPVHRVLFGFETSNGPALGGFELRHPENFTHGFRPHRMPKDVAVSRFFGGLKLKASFGQRVDHAWIHTRAGEQRHQSLKEKSVILIGCGSLGSGLAMLLAKSGVGNLVLVDGELLSWDNIGRHTLGASAVNQNKADALAFVINRDVPSISARAVERSWQEALDQKKLKFEDSDLVITTTADWTSDSMLNFKARSEAAFPPLLFGWLEPHALAGTGLLVMDLGGCYACGVNKTGAFAQRLSDWPEGGEMRRLPACGGHYQPYGPIHLSTVQGLLASMALDSLCDKVARSERRSWLGSITAVEQEGGTFSAFAKERFSDDGGFRTEAWKKSTACQLCV